MAADLICGAAFGSLLNSTILPLIAAATMATITLIAVAFMAGRVMANPKLLLWAKTELIQMAVSLVSVTVLMLTVQGFCAINMSEVAGYFGLTASSGSVYAGAMEYLTGALHYTHNALQVVRYHLEAYMVLAYFNAFICDYNIGNIGLGCFFGYAGDTQSPFGGYGTQLATLNAFFSSTIIAQFSVLNFLFILLFVYKGFVFLFLPFGIFLRSMPYMRSFGSLFIALAMSFLIVYPFILAVFNLMGGVLFDRPNYAPSSITMSDYDESIFSDAANGFAQILVSVGGKDVVRCTYFGDDDGECMAEAAASQALIGGIYGLPPEKFVKEKLADTVAFAAYAFLAGVFFPSSALLAAIASVGYMTRLMGEEIDLSRLTQLV